MSECDPMQGYIHTIYALNNQIDRLEESLDAIAKSKDRGKSVKNHAKLCLRQSRLERFLSIENPGLYKRAQDHLNQLENPES